MPLLLTTLAEYQTRFWIVVARALAARGVDLAVLSFDDRSSELLRAAGIETFTVGTDPIGEAAVAASFAAVSTRVGMVPAEHWLAHERVAFGIRDGVRLRAAFVRKLGAAEAALGALAVRGTPVVVQELGGFTSVLATYFAARDRGVDNWFIEPSFFRGRFFLTANSFGAPRPPAHAPGAASPEVERYLDATIEAGAIVVPAKDRHHYTAAAGKVLNRGNLKRLAEKLRDKHLLGKRQEFGHIGVHVAQHLRMLRNSRRLAGRTTPLASLGRFVYFPFHVPADAALTLRAPAFLDQIALVDLIARSVPDGVAVAVKEHPAQLGALDAGRLAALLARYDHVALLPPDTNNFAALRAAACVVTVNSKSGAESLLLGRPTLVLGDAFYGAAPGATRLPSVDALPGAIAAALAAPPPDPAPFRRWLQGVWNATFPGELYVADAANAEAFAASLAAGVARR